MLRKLYPADQIEKFLLLDVIILVFLIYRVWVLDVPYPILVKIGFLLLFLAAYYICLWQRRWLLLLGSYVGFLLILALSVYEGMGALLYGFVFADLLGRADRKRVIGFGMVGIAAMFLMAGWIHEGEPAGVFRTVSFPVMIIQLAVPPILQAREGNKALKEKLNLANAQLERYIQEEERNRIARDLHDTLGQTLTMIKMKSELTIRLVDQRPDQAKEELRDIVNTSRHALKQVRELVTGMKFVPLEKEIEVAGELLQKVGIQLLVSNQTPLTPLSPVAETMLALSVREAVTNILKHSGASECTITRDERDQRLYLEVSDNGNGQLEPGKGNGVQSFQERMAMLQGEVEIKQRPGQGTSITFIVPLLENRG
ncbi:sensor histidine kinase [Paenibacillus rubinfantis]|uniref:sensor histidine kinase n=1 Tax=Paenibacillus rubinfantis TaxID=1720296 RepID=UPI00073F0B8A|nr:sensor histidine kinase [Paenibacillus rubinfantis]